MFLIGHKHLTEVVDIILKVISAFIFIENGELAVFKNFKLILMQEKVLNSKDLFCIKETLFNIGRGGFIFTTSLLILPNL